MTRLGLGLTVCASCITAVANILLRLSLGNGFEGMSCINIAVRQLTDMRFILGVVFYVLAMFFWFWIVSIEPVDTAYPVLVGIIFLILLSHSIFIENGTVSTCKILGAVLIFLGIVFSSRA